MSRPMFTPERARSALRFVRPAAERLCRVFRRMEQTHPVCVQTDEPVRPDYFRLLRELTTTVELLDSAGVRVKDPRQGLIDFPACRAGRRVWLCWRVGEPTVAFWHEMEAGFAGRRPIDDGGPWQDAAGGRKDLDKPPGVG